MFALSGVKYIHIINLSASKQAQGELMADEEKGFAQFDEDVESDRKRSYSSEDSEE